MRVLPQGNGIVNRGREELEEVGRRGRGQAALGRNGTGKGRLCDLGPRGFFQPVLTEHLLQVLFQAPDMQLPTRQSGLPPAVQKAQ